MLCQFERLIYPRDVHNGDMTGYMIAVYRPCEKIRDHAGNVIATIKAVGYGLPVSEKLKFDLKGSWKKDEKYGIQFEVESYTEFIDHNREGIIAYLSSGQIKGIGSRTAEKIYDMFGNDTLCVLDREPERLLAVSGISKTKLEKIIQSYLANRAARDVIAFLTPHGVTAARAIKLFKKYKHRTMEVVRKHPYRICEMAGVGFKTADKIALSMGFDRLSTDRVDEGLLYTLSEAESRGHLCMEKHEFIDEALKILDTEELTVEMAANRAVRLMNYGKISCYGEFVYSMKTERTEKKLAELIHEQSKGEVSMAYRDLDSELRQAEQRFGIRLATEQKNAVKAALTKNLSIITGGPGTGKTLIQRAIIDIYRRNNPDGIICCCAPTGRAARRMEQSTGYPASTIHRSLGLIAGDDGKYGDPEKLDANLMIVDEVSMLDAYLACAIFKAVRKETQVVLIGDADQLPSVGPGAVLSEIIASRCIPVVRLDRVFRQDAGSRIALNARIIRNGDTRLDYGSDFEFLDSPDISQSAEMIIRMYLKEADRYGVDNVALLTPFRQRTDTGVNVINERIRDIVNPAVKSKQEISTEKKTFRLGDKVMQIKNHMDVSNGDIGYIVKIAKRDDEKTAYVDFGDGRIREYEKKDLGMLELGYATTVHKSQGAEYKSVIINLQMAHYIMLTRPLIYTAITRGKSKVIIVGERRALSMAIKRKDTEKRGTCLAKRIVAISEERGEDRWQMEEAC